MPSKFGLVDIVDADGSLDTGTRLEYHSLAVLYERDFVNNLSKTSIDLDSTYDTGNPVQWQRFLNHSGVKQFIENYLYEIADKKALTMLGEDLKDSNAALRVREMIDKKKKKDDNSHIIVMLLPQKDLE